LRYVATCWLVEQIPKEEK